MPQSWLISAPIAHRGLHDLQAGRPEDSLAAIAAAADAGYPVEIDVHLLADGELAVFHDFDLARMCRDERPVARCTSGEIRPLRLAGTDEGIPLLPEVLAAVAGRVGLLIEIKNDRRTDRRCEQTLARLLDAYRGEFAVQSFNPFSVQWFARNRPAMLRGQLACKFRGERLPLYKKLLLSNLMMNFVSRPQFIAYKFDELPRLAVTRCRNAGLPVLGWTVRSADEQARAMQHCDNIVFENYRPPKGGGVGESPLECGGSTPLSILRGDDRGMR